jgi:membrane protein
VLTRLREGVEQRLFGIAGTPNAFALALRVLAYPYAVLRDLAGGQLTLRATGLVYATLMSVIPGVALTFALLKAFGIHRDLAPLIHEFFRPLGADADAITARVLDFADNVRGGLVGSVGFLLLMWTLIGTVKRVEDSLNYVWRVQVARSFARRMAEYAALLLTAPLLIVSVVGFTKLAVDSVGARAPGALLLELAPYGIVTLLFTAIYVVIPNTHVRFVPALIGAVCAGVLWALVGKTFTLLVLYSSRLTLVYAGFAVIVALLLWTYLGWLILLAGAQLSFYVQNPSYLRLGLTPLHLSNREKERLALNMLLLVARRGAMVEPPYTLGALAQAAGLPGLALAPVVEALEEAGLVALGSRETLQLTRAPETIRLAEILAAVRHRRRGHRLLHVVALPEVELVQRELEAALNDALGGRTLAELAIAEPAAMPVPQV